MDSFLQILISTLPGLVVAGFMYLLVKRFIEREEKLRFLTVNKETKKELLQLKLQAHERLMVLLERSGFQPLKQRFYKNGMQADMFVFTCVKGIDMELEHNITQQLYVSDKAWVGVKKAMDDQKMLMMTALGEAQKSGADFFESYANVAEEIEHLSMEEAGIILKAEMRRLF